MGCANERSFDAVLFDWCGTLVEYPSVEDRFRLVLRRLGRSPDEAAVAGLAEAVRHAKDHPSAIESAHDCDLSAENHRATKLLICELAGIDRDLALEFERSYGDLGTYQTYPEVVDVVTTLATSGVKLAIVSDFDVDIRPHLDSLGLGDLISGFVLSCEVGTAKPDPSVFRAALQVVDVEADRCLMVGDNPTPDMGAAALGIATRILPVRRRSRPPLLERVVPLVLS